MASIGLGMMSQLMGLFTALLAIGIYALVYEHVALCGTCRPTRSWCGSGALLMYDLCYYWLHRAGPPSRRCSGPRTWCTTRARTTTSRRRCGRPPAAALLGWLFYLPMAVVGVPPLVFGVVALIDLLYQFWVHTQQVGKLGWFDRWFCSPVEPPRAPRGERHATSTATTAAS